MKTKSKFLSVYENIAVWFFIALFLAVLALIFSALEKNPSKVFFFTVN